MTLSLNKREDFYKLIDLLDLNIGIEIGVQEGLFSDYILKSKIKKLYLVDCWEKQSNYKDVANVDQNKQNLLYETVKNKYKDENRVKIIKKYSNVAVNDFNDNYFDFIYIDADHSYQSVTEDLLMWYPKLKIGGIFAGHDYLNGFVAGSNFGVKQAVDEFVSKHKCNLMITEEAHGWKSWYFKKDNSISYK